MRVLLIFLDGVGLGESVPNNPFYCNAYPRLQGLLGDNPLISTTVGYMGEKASLLQLDTRLGVEGVPQSATGQATIFTGKNAPRFLGAHLNGFPNTALRELLAQEGIFRSLCNRGYSCTFINAYRPLFFDLLKQGLPGQNYSCSTLVTYYGGLPFYTLEDIKDGRALYMDITNISLRQMGYDVPEISPEEGGIRLAQACIQYDFTMFEYFLSDLAGHSGSQEEASFVLETLDPFIGAVIDSLDLSQTLVIVTSDHGNFEDVTCRTHTLNPVPGLLIGPADLRAILSSKMLDLTHVLPAVVEALNWGS